MLCCSVCRSDFEIAALEKRDENILSGFLICPECCTAVPVCAGFPLFPEVLMYHRNQHTMEYLRTLEAKLFGDPSRYEAFVQKKYQRPSHDAYAAFQPFNESSQAFLPFIPLLRSVLKPGDRILDTWCRTGWSAGFLSGLFPEQKIISIWEGNSDTLGYRGFRYWYSDSIGETNMDILFHSLNDPLPFKSKSIDVVHGLDTLHRYRQHVALPELLRVTKDHGTLVFPHVHLSNSQPEPYFDRGGFIIHGRDYKDYLENKLQTSGRKVFVLSEPGAFRIKGPEPLRDNSDTSDYNGLVAVVRETLEGFPLHREPIDQSGDAYVLVNPLLSVDLSTGTVSLDTHKLSGSVEKLFFRHPIYEKTLRQCTIHALSVDTCEMIYWSSKILTLEEIAARMKKSVSDLNQILAPLVESELLQVWRVPENTARLQFFHSNQRYVPRYTKQTVKEAFDGAVVKFADLPLLISEEDDSTFLYRDAADIVAAVTDKLLQSGVRKGDRILVYCEMHPEAIFLFWAAMRMGAVFVPVDPLSPKAVLEDILRRVDAKLLFCDDARLDVVSASMIGSTVTFDSATEEDRSGLANTFSDWVNKRAEESQPLPLVCPEDSAVILFTSGTTGKSKGVILSQGALYRSGLLVAETYRWETGDILCSMGELHAMSGLRNPCIATLFAGASALVLSSKIRSNAIALAGAISSRRATILSTVPSTIRQLEHFKDRIGRESLSTLRMALCTGSDLTEHLARSFTAQFNVPVFNYYGLTETCGFCIGVPAENDKPDYSTVGIPVGCIAQVVDDAGRVVEAGQIGELRIFSDNLMQGYYQDEALTQTVLKNGWFYTGDLAEIGPDHRVRLTGRKKDIIKDKFGNIVHPSEVEACLTSHHGIADAVVLGFRHNEEDEKLAAFIIPRDAATPAESLLDEVRIHIRDRLGVHKVPQVFRIKEHLPRSSGGKIERQPLLAELK